MACYAGRQVEEPTRTRRIEPHASSEGPACLEVLAGTTVRGPISLAHDVVVLGRAIDADVRLQADGVSRKHAKIVRSATGGHSLIDLGAKNRTFLNGRPVDVAALREGDRIQLGQVVLRYGTALQPRQETAVPVQTLLSERELEIAELVAEGLTNVEIGRRLGISRRTVATHLERAYERLGIHSRAALASRLRSG